MNTETQTFNQKTEPFVHSFLKEFLDDSESLKLLLEFTPSDVYTTEDKKKMILRDKKGINDGSIGHSGLMDIARRLGH